MCWLWWVQAEFIGAKWAADNLCILPTLNIFLVAFVLERRGQIGTLAQCPLDLSSAKARHGHFCMSITTSSTTFWISCSF